MTGMGFSNEATWLTPQLFVCGMRMIMWQCYCCSWFVCVW